MTSDPPEATDPATEPTALRYEGTVVHLAAEYWPYARTGGLAEAVRGIATYQAEAGTPTLVFMPLYRGIQEGFPEVEPAGDPFPVQVGPRTETARIFHNVSAPSEPRVLFVEHDGYFGRMGVYGEDDHDYPDNHLRFAFFCAAALEWLRRAPPGPTLLHAHDWHTALAIVYLRTVLAGDPYLDEVGTVLTVHNGGYQGHYGREVLLDLGLPDWLFHWDYMEWYGRLNLLKGGLTFSDMATTVSPTHARELRTRTGGFGLQETFNDLQDHFVGILNGIDYNVWDPRTDKWLASHFGAEDLSGKAACKAWLQRECGLPVDSDIPVFGMTARLAEQKGFDILLAAKMIPRLDAQWIFVGEGERRYRDALQALVDTAPDRIVARFEFTETREHQLLAGADFLLMPSLYEPCGLTQMRAQRYGALPVVRRVGGLADTVEDRVTGFVFDEYQPWALEEAVQYAINLYEDRTAWESHVRDAMSRDWGWDRSVQRYQQVYHQAAELRRAYRAIHQTPARP
jgi:starch synthase